MEYCPRCKEKWFSIGMKNGICRRCFNRDRKKLAHEPNFFPHDNALDFGVVSDHLPELSQIEEMLIASKYRGHVINFLRDVGSVYTQLPLLPQDLDVIFLRPSNSTAEQPHIVRQFITQFRVREQNIRIWLQYLKQHHPSYQDVLVDEVSLSQLPDDANVEGNLLIELSGEVQIEDQEGVDDNQPPATSDDYDIVRRLCNVTPLIALAATPVGAARAVTPRGSSG